jgi:hypothetical protein
MVGFESSSYTKITGAFVLFECLACSVTRDRHSTPKEKQMKFFSSKSEINDESVMWYSSTCCEWNWNL